MSESPSSGQIGCGCIGWIITILVFWALWFGLPINDKKWNIDIFPPRIWDMNAQVNQPSIPAPQPSAVPSTPQATEKLEKEEAK